MKKTKASISIALIIAFCMTVMAPAYAVTVPTTQEKAVALSKLSIISGTNGNYNLTGYLKRYEAAVFLVRMLGKIEELKDQEKNYGQTGFSDVPSATWYAPYIGYCVKAGYISGVGDNKFKPDTQISEKAFLSVALRALGYKDGIDFSWSNVYQKALSFGLLKDTTYASKTADKTNYTRGDMVSMLYNAMDVKFKGSENTLLDNLIGSGAVTKETVRAAGFSLDKLPTAVSSVSPTAFNKLTVKFNENILSIATENIVIYETLDKTKKLSCTVASLSGSELQLNTGVQLPDRAYTIEFKNIRDNEDNLVVLLSSNFKGFKVGVTNDFFFRIQKVDCVNKNTFNIYFTHPINTNAEIPLYYEILDGEKSLIKGSYQNMSAKCIGGADNGVSVSLQNYELSKDSIYIVKVSGDFCSAYGAELNEGKGDEAVFTGNGVEDADFNVTSIKVTGSNSLEVEFNRYIDSFYGKQFLNYTITGPNNTGVVVSKAVISSSGDKKGKVVQLNTQSQFDRTKQYSLNINFLPDLYKKSNISDKNVQFSGNYDLQTGLKIIDCKATDTQTVVITFDRPVDAVGAENTSYYSITGSSSYNYYTVPLKARYEEIGGIGRVRLYLPADKPLEGSKLYKARISRMLQGITGLPSTTDMEIPLQGSSEKNTKPTISEIAVVSKDTMRIRFNKDIAADMPNVLASNYTLEYKQDGVIIKKVPSIVGYINETTLILKFDRITTGLTYKLSFDSINDYAGTSVRTASDGQNFIEFNYKK